MNLNECLHEHVAWRDGPLCVCGDRHVVCAVALCVCVVTNTWCVLWPFVCAVASTTRKMYFPGLFSCPWLRVGLAPLPSRRAALSNTTRPTHFIQVGLLFPMSDPEGGFVTMGDSSEESFFTEDCEEETEVQRALNGPATIPSAELANVNTKAPKISVEMVFCLLPTGLRAALQTGQPCSVSFFFSTLLPWIHFNATKYSPAFQTKYPRSIEGDVKTEFVSIDDILTVVCGAFVSCIGVPPSDEDGDFRAMTMQGAFVSRKESAVAIIQCWLNYLVENCNKRRVSNGMIVARHNAQNKELQAAIRADPLILPVVSSDKPIEAHTGTCQVDFANSLIGGSTLDGAAVQEEIMIAQKPDLLFLLWWASRMAPGEALSATAEPFNKTRGFSRSFEFVDTISPADKTTKPVDVSSHFSSTTAVYQAYPEVCVAMDAYNRSVGARGVKRKHGCSGNMDDQERSKWTPRDLKKVFAAAMSPISGILGPTKAPGLCTLSTGNWGCGIFGGDSMRMATIQLAGITLASHANPNGFTNMVHCHFGDPKTKHFGDKVDKMLKQGKTVQHLLNNVLDIKPQTPKERDTTKEQKRQKNN